MNAQNLLGQMMKSSNPMQMLVGMLTPNQKQLVNNFQNQTNEKQAEEIARMCNEKGITKEQLATIINAFKK